MRTVGTRIRVADWATSFSMPFQLASRLYSATPSGFRCSIATPAGPSYGAFRMGFFIVSRVTASFSWRASTSGEALANGGHVSRLAG